MAPFQQLCEHIETRMKALNIPGVAVGVWQHGEQATANFGVTSIDHPLPVIPGTLFQIGSISKTMLATCLMRLVEQGKAELDRPVRAYLPELRLADETTAARLTLRHLLTHTGGWAGDYFNDFGWGDDALAKMVASLERLPQLTPLGSLWHYNNAGFAIAGRVIEVTSGLTFENALSSLLFQPLGMYDSFYFPEDVMVRRFATGHFASAERAASLALPWPIGRANHPAGGVVSSINDLLRYARFHLGDGCAESGERLLTAASLAEMRRPQAWPGISADAMGLTWFIKKFGEVTCYRHGGSTHGQNGQFLFAPGYDFAFALLTNAESGDTLGMELFPLAAELFLGAVEPPSVTYTLPEGRLAEYAGSYDAQAQTICLSPKDGGLHVEIRNKGGFPTPETPASPDPEPFESAFYAEDHTIVTGGPEKGTRAQFLRDGSGAIEWMRVSGRIHRKI
jgi:CubicO group peptidase (beta-lactamase class C family)